MLGNPLSSSSSPLLTTTSLPCSSYNLRNCEVCFYIVSEVAQSCPTLRDPMDCSLPGSSIHGILQARVLECGAKLCLTFCHPMDCSPPVCPVHGILQARILAWVASIPSPGNLPYPGIEPWSPALQADSLLSEPPQKPTQYTTCSNIPWDLMYIRLLCIVSEKATAPHSSTLAWKNPMDGGAWWAAVHGVAKSQTQLSDFTFTFHFHEMATHSSVLAWRIPGRGSLVGCHLWGRTESDTTEET